MKKTETSNSLADAVYPSGEFRSYMGGFYKCLISPEQTGGSLALLDMTLPKGTEPPRHVHTHEDETFYLLEGEISFHIGEEIIMAKSGQAVFAPRLVPHHFTIHTATARFLTLITPGRFAAYFEEFSVAAEFPEIVPPQGPPPAEYIRLMTSRLETQFGLLFI